MQEPHVPPRATGSPTTRHLSDTTVRRTGECDFSTIRLRQVIRFETTGRGMQGSLVHCIRQTAEHRFLTGEFCQARRLHPRALSWTSAGRSCDQGLVDIARRGGCAAHKQMSTIWDGAAQRACFSGYCHLVRLEHDERQRRDSLTMLKCPVSARGRLDLDLY
jgi:hypothetical protein